MKTGISRRAVLNGIGQSAALGSLGRAVAHASARGPAGRAQRPSLRPLSAKPAAALTTAPLRPST